MIRARGAVPLVVALVIALVTVVLFGFSPTLHPIDALLGRGAMVTVPDLVGDAKPRATSELERLELVPEFEESYSLTAPRGSVISTDPKAGERIRQGEAVTVVVSLGINRVVMPDAVGKQIDEVKVPFEEADVPFAVDEVFDDYVPQGTVMEQSPAPGITVTATDEVRFAVSAGPRERTVPEVAGLSPDGAGFALGEAGLVVGEVIERDDATAPAGVVMGTEPGAGTVQPYRTPIRVVVSSGAPPVPMPQVVNTSRRSATDQLRAAGFVVAVASRLIGDGERGLDTVLEQYPAAGVEWRPGQQVTIVVGRQLPVPPPPTTTTVPPSTTTTSTTTTSTVPEADPGD